MTHMDECFPTLDTPSVLIDLAVVRRNIRAMVEGLHAQGIAHRPHFKAHKSLYLARLQLDMGACGMTCATLGEAEVLAAGNITDIFIAYPIVGDIKLRRLLALGERADVCVVVNSQEGAQAMSEVFAQANRRQRVLVELEGGMERSGITLDTIAKFAQGVAALPGLVLDGVMSYHGTIYGMQPHAFSSHARREAADLLAAKAVLEAVSIPVRVLSGGSSFTSKMPAYLAGLTEARAGNYVFNDVAQLSTGLVTENDCAMTVLATVVTRPDARHAVIDAGSKTLSSDTTSFGKGFGRVLGQPEWVVYKLSEEHGYIQLPENAQPAVGDRLRIIPNHACIPPNLTDCMYGIEGSTLVPIAVDARGCNR